MSQDPPPRPLAFLSSGGTYLSRRLASSSGPRPRAPSTLEQEKRLARFRWSEESLSRTKPDIRVLAVYLFYLFSGERLQDVHE